MRYFVFIGIFLVGGILGYLVGVNETAITVVESETSTEYITEVVHDTVVEKERVEVPVFVESADSLEKTSDVDTLKTSDLRDTLLQDTTLEDSTYGNGKESEVIKRDRMVQRVKLPIHYLQVTEETDSTLQNLLGITTKQAQEIEVQFWESPLNFEGYKLGKKLLVVYGLSPQFDYDFFNKENVYYLSNGEIVYEMQITHDFKPYKVVSKNKLMNG